MIFKIANRSFVVCIFLTALFACNKLDLAPSDRFTELTFWQVDANVNNAVYNIYNGIYSSTAVFYNDALSDNAFAKLAGSTNADIIAGGTFLPSAQRFQNDWSFYYSGIKSCNIFLENVDKNTSLSIALKDRMKAEVRFIRAWHHFNLTKWWGDVPLLTKDITGDEAKSTPRTPHADVVKFILSELDAVAGVLPTKDQYSAADNGRITKGAALALKARVLLYEGNRMAEVAATCEKLMGGEAGNYGLASKYSDLFADPATNKSNTESILAIQYAPVLRTWGDHIDLIPISAGARTGGMSPTQELVDDYVMLNGKGIKEAGSGYDPSNSYANRDPRLTSTVVYDGYVWTNPGGSTQKIYIKPGSTPAGQSAANEYSTAGQGSATGYYWRKYFDPNYSSPGISSGLNIHLIRYADVLLMYAEAKQSLGQMDATVWNKTIKLIRQRAGFTDAAATDYPTSGDLTTIIRRERRAEFALEGLRIDDIRRWKIAQNVLNGWAHGGPYGDPSIDSGFVRVQQRTFNASKHYLWPIPPSEIALDAQLTQNPNY
jgi:starch-binding outer membrane protein, SusD/RagB family